MNDKVIVSDAVSFLSRIDEEISMIYFDPPYGHGTFGKNTFEWLFESLKIAEKKISCSGIIYFHVDALFVSEYHDYLPWHLFRGQIVWKTGWVSGFKSKTTKFWPRNHQLILGFAKKEASDFVSYFIFNVAPINCSARAGRLINNFNCFFSGLIQ